MLLKNKNAIIYGGSGAIGSSVAKAFSREGARVFLAARTLECLDKVAIQIREAGGEAETTSIDAFDKQAVDAYVSTVVQKAGSIDISFNAVGIGGIHGTSLKKMNYEEFALPVLNAIHTYFITATAAAHHMEKQGAGVILAITANAARKPYADVGGFGVAGAAIEAFCRQLAIEEGKYGIRVVCIRSAGSPDAPGVDEAFKQHAKNAGISREAFEKEFAARTMLKKLPLLEDIAGTAVLMASDKAGAVTAAVINATCGEMAD